MMLPKANHWGQPRVAAADGSRVSGIGHLPSHAYMGVQYFDDNSDLFYIFAEIFPDGKL